MIHVFTGGEEIVATPSHPFYVAKIGWINAADLRAGDELVLVNGELVVVEIVQHELLENTCGLSLRTMGNRSHIQTQKALFSIYFMFIFII